MNKEIIGTAKVLDPSATATIRIADGTVEVGEKIASEPMSGIMHDSGELWEFGVWRAALNV